jgi:hypothetical protein
MTLMQQRRPGGSASLQLPRAAPATSMGNTAVASSSSLQESKGLAVWTLRLLVLEASRVCLSRSLQQSQLLPLR